jgi:hypothetical protein
MTAQTLLWLTSCLGAALFFAAGTLIAPGRRRARRSALGAIPGMPMWEPDTEQAAIEPALIALREEAALARGESAALIEGREELEAELLTLKAELIKLHQVSARQLEETERQHRISQAARTEMERLRGELAAASSARADLEVRLARMETLEDELADKRLEVERWREQLAHAEARLGEAPHPDVEHALRQDLAAAGRVLSAHEERVRRFEQENARLHQDLAQLPLLEAERERLREENAQLRAGAFAARAAAPEPALVVAPGLRRGDVLQSLVERVSRLADIRSAVIADELGLVVASHGELAEEVAAVGALLTRAGVQAQQVLPLRTVHRVTVADDQGVLLSLCPLRHAEPFDGDLALITLAVGPGPDQHLVTRLLEESPSARSMA